jgi:sulfatase modifying factor 1
MALARRLRTMQRMTLLRPLSLSKPLRPLRRLLVGSLVLLACLPHAQAAPAQPRQITNSLGIPLVRIPAGTFRMGSDEPLPRLHKAYPLAEQERLVALKDEAPVHTVRISRAFYMGQTEVTVGQFRRFVQASGYVPES